MKTTIILFLLDAFRYDYLSKKNTPFLWRCSEEGKYIKHLIPSSGFCERTEIFYGKEPLESGYFTAIGFDPNESEYKNNKIINILGEIELVISDILNLNEDIVNISRRILEYLFVKLIKYPFRLKPYKIPFYLLKYFDLTEDKQDFKSRRNSDDKSIFNYINSCGGSTFFNSFTSIGNKSNGSDIDRIELAKQAVNNHMFIPIYINAVDTAGHMYGPDSNAIKKELRKIDRMLEETVNEIKNSNNLTKFIFLGDHGMSKVNKTINIKKHINMIAKIKKLKQNKDYIYFLDSTIFRIWFFNKDAENLLKDCLLNDPLFTINGEFINDHLKNKYSLPLNDRKYGDLTWWANEGVLIFPDYFHSKNAYNGMHGYRIDSKSTHGMCIIYGDNISSSYSHEMSLSKIYDLIINL